MDAKKRKDIEKKTRFDAAGAYDALVAKGVDATIDDFNAIMKPRDNARAAIEKAIEDYHADLARRKAILDKQTAAMDERIEEILDWLDEVENLIRNAVSDMDLDTAAQYEEQAEALRDELEPLQRKRKVVDSAELRGDAEIYQRLQDAIERRKIAEEICNQYRSKALDWTEASLRNLKAVDESARRHRMIDLSYGDGYLQKRLDEIYRHFTGELTAEEKRMQALSGSTPTL